MAVETPGGFNQNSTYSAEVLRRAFGTLLARGSSIGSVVGGLVNATDCQLTPPGSGMSVNVGPGQVWVPGSSSASQAAYSCWVSSSSNLAIATSNPTNPRIDTVVAVVTDSAYSGATNTFAVGVVTGTATAGATLANLNGAGAAPASSLILGYVLVPASATNIVSGDLASVATTADINPYMANTSTKGTLSGQPAAGILGRAYYATDTVQWSLDTGSTWTPLGLTPKSTSTGITASNGQAIITTGSSAITITLPSHTAGQTIAVMNRSTGGTTVSGTSIQGVGLSSASSFPLGTVGASAVLLDDGTNWNLIGGQQDTGWVALTLASGFTNPGGGYVPSVRLSGDRVWFSGLIHNNTGSSVSGGTTLATFASTFSPASTVFVVVAASSTVNELTVVASGTALQNVPTITSGQTVVLDGVNYRLN